MKILVAGDSTEEVKGRVASAHRWWGRNEEVSLAPLVCYYPYYFQAWKVRASKSLGREVRVRLFTGVNGMNRSTSPATEWPAEEERDVREEELIHPLTSGDEAEELSGEYIEKFVARRYRPSGTPEITRERSALIYIPYYVHAQKGRPLRKARLVEGFTGAVGRVKDVPPILEAVSERRMAT